MTDRIERTLTIRAAPEVVFSALTDPEHLVRWFPKRVEGSISEGGKPLFCWGEYGSSRLHIVAVDAPRYFAFRWVPGIVSSQFPEIDGRATTLVEFSLEPCPEGTRLNLVESGFASLPADEIEAALRDNSEGWDEELVKLTAYSESLS